MNMSGLEKKKKSDEKVSSSSTSTSTLLASLASAQLMAAWVFYSNGYGAASVMPTRAFCIASLIIGAGACSLTAALHAAGIQQIDDLKRVGQSLRRNLGVPQPPRPDS